MEVIDKILEYVSLGYEVFPCLPMQKLPAVPFGVHDGTRDIDQIHRWFREKPRANWGIVCDGLIVIDCDTGNDWHGTAKLIDLANCPTQISPGGIHFIYRRPEGHNWRNTSCVVAPKIDTKTDAGYFLAEPSIRSKGAYEFDRPLLPIDELPYPPEWLVKELDVAMSRPEVVVPQTRPPIDNVGDVFERAVRYVDACPEAVSGQGGHSQTFSVTTALVHGFCLEEGQALQILTDYYNPRCNPPWSESELRHKVKSSLENPPSKQRGWLLESIAKEHPDVDITALVQKAVEVKESDKEETSESNRIWKPFPYDLFPEAVRRFIIEAAATMNVDESFLALPVLVAAASAIGNGFEVRIKRGWSEPPVLWGCIIGDSGATKTPPLHQVVKPIDTVQNIELQRAFAEERDPNFRLLVSDITVEALADRLRLSPEGVLVYVDELSGWFASMAQYKRKGNDEQHWLVLHGAKPLNIDRKTGLPHISIPRASACVLGGIQPSVLADAFRVELTASGLAARILFTFPPSRKRRWTDDELSEETERAWHDIVERLLSIRNLASEEGNLTHPRAGLSDEARTMFADFVNRRGDEMEYMPGDIKSIYSKLEGGAARFALVVHCLRWACSEIDDRQLLSVDRTSMSKGITLSDWFLHEAIRNQTALTMDHQRLKASELAGWLAERPSGVTARELSKLRAGSYPDTDSAKEALDRLVEEGFATTEKSKRTIKYFFCEKS